MPNPNLSKINLKLIHTKLGFNPNLRRGPSNPISHRA